MVLLPGNYARDFVASSLPQLASLPCVTYSNYLGDALDATVELGFEDVLVVGHIGKLVKLAGGIMNTHSKVADCRMELMCAHAAICGADAEMCTRIVGAATTDAGLAILDEAGLREDVMRSLLDAMQRHLDHRTQGALRVGVLTFSNELGLLGLTSSAHEVLTSWGIEVPGEQGGRGATGGRDVAGGRDAADARDTVDARGATGSPGTNANNQTEGSQ